MKIFGYNKIQNTDFYIKKSLENYFGVTKEFQIIRTKNGKPILRGCSEVFIGVTHTDNVIFVGVGNINFGIDAEKSDRTVNQKTAYRVFTQKEIDSGEEYIDLWVKKEAYIKFMGKTLLCLPDIDVTLLKGRFFRLNIENYKIYIYSESGDFEEILYEYCE